jgi:hypothetical protein
MMFSSIRANENYICEVYTKKVMIVITRGCLNIQIDRQTEQKVETVQFGFNRFSVVSIDLVVPTAFFSVQIGLIASTLNRSSFCHMLITVKSLRLKCYLSSLINVEISV